MGDETRRPVLEDHVPEKRRLAPPLVKAFGGKLSEYSWTRQLVPEAIWLALFIDHFGYEKARDICVELVQTVDRPTEKADFPMFVKFSAFSALDTKQKSILASTLDPSTRRNINAALRPLTSISSDHPLAFLEQDLQDEDPINDHFAMILRDCYDRNGRLSVLSMALAYYLGIEQGKIHVAPHLIDDLLERFDAIGAYPESDAAKLAAGAFRAAAPMLFMEPEESGRGFQKDEEWVRNFWSAVSGFGPCLFPDTLQDQDSISEDPAEAFVVDYRNAARADLRARLGQWHLDLHEVESYEVLSALLCRQTTLATELAYSPAIWTPHTAPIILRAMADVFITLAWILKDRNIRSRKFVEDGLGAIKLQIAHYERALEKATDPDDQEQMRQMIDIWGSWLASQKMEDFVWVNLGSWSGLNTRKMAEEAGFIDFYNYVYQPFSGAAHSNWAHISAFNAVHCQNPAHRLHRAPAIAQIDPDVHWLFLAAKYLSKTFLHFDEMIGLSGLKDSGFDFIKEHTTSPTTTTQADG